MEGNDETGFAGQAVSAQAVEDVGKEPPAKKFRVDEGADNKEMPAEATGPEEAKPEEAGEAEVLQVSSQLPHNHKHPRAVRHASRQSLAGPSALAASPLSYHVARRADGGQRERWGRHRSAAAQDGHGRRGGIATSRELHIAAARVERAAADRVECSAAS